MSCVGALCPGSCIDKDKCTQAGGRINLNSCLFCPSTSSGYSASTGKCLCG